MIKMKNPPGLYVIHMLESDGVKRRALRARRLERPPINFIYYLCGIRLDTRPEKVLNKLNTVGVQSEILNILFFLPDGIDMF